MEQYSIQNYFYRIPPVTKAISILSILFSLLYSFNYINVMRFLLDWSLVVRKLQIWRLFTDYLFCGSFSFSWFLNMYFFIHFSSLLENHSYFSIRKKGYGSYLYFILFQMITLNLLSLALYYPQGRGALRPSLSFAIICYWSKIDSATLVNVWGLILKASQLPYALLILSFVQGESLVTSLFGFISSNIYYYIKYSSYLDLNLKYYIRDNVIFPSNLRILETPEIIKKIQRKIDHINLLYFSGNSLFSHSTNVENREFNNKKDSQSQQSSGSCPRNIFQGRAYRLMN